MNNRYYILLTVKYSIIFAFSINNISSNNNTANDWMNKWTRIKIIWREKKTVWYQSVSKMPCTILMDIRITQNAQLEKNSTQIKPRKICYPQFTAKVNLMSLVYGITYVWFDLNRSLCFELSFVCFFANIFIVNIHRTYFKLEL